MKTRAHSPRGPTGPTMPAGAGAHGRVSRRHFLAATAAAGAAGDGLSGWAFGPAATTVELTRHDVLLPGLPAPLDGLRIGQVSDVHLPANAGAVRNALALLEAERPEIVLLTGDIVERAIGAGRSHRLCAAGSWHHRHLRSDGKLGALRRHRADSSRAGRTRRPGCSSSATRRRCCSLGSARLGIVGLDDIVRGRPDAAQALARVDHADAMLWAFHSPEFADRIPAGTPASLLLSGHTHGGQIRLPLLPPFRPVRVGALPRGMVRHGDRAPLRIARGRHDDHPRPIPVSSRAAGLHPEADAERPRRWLSAGAFPALQPQGLETVGRCRELEHERVGPELGVDRLADDDGAVGRGGLDRESGVTPCGISTPAAVAMSCSFGGAAAPAVQTNAWPTRHRRRSAGRWPRSPAGSVGERVVGRRDSMKFTVPASR